MEDNSHTSKTGLRTSTPREPCGAADIIWPRNAVSLNICACQYRTPTKPNTFSTDHAPPRNTTSYRQAATNCSTLHQRRHFTARPLLLGSVRTGMRKKSGFRMIYFEHRTLSAVSARVGVSAPLCDTNLRMKHLKRRPHSVRRPASLRYYVDLLYAEISTNNTQNVCVLFGPAGSRNSNKLNAERIC